MVQPLQQRGSGRIPKYLVLFPRSVPFLLLQPTGNIYQRTYPFSISTSSNICSSVNIELDFIINMNAMNANLGANGSSPCFYNSLYTSGAGHSPISLCGREAGHGYNPLYMGDSYAVASASLNSGIPSAAALGPVDWDDGSYGEDPCIGQLCEALERLGVSDRSASELERYEENLCLLMQDFESKARHEYVLTGEWPKPECEESALQLSGRLDGVEWRKVSWRPGYMEELDLLWRAKVRFAERDEVYQVVWEFVAGLARIWVDDKDRHEDCYRGRKDVFRLERPPSVRRENRYFLPGGAPSLRRDAWYAEVFGKRPRPRNSACGGFIARWTRPGC